MRSIGVIVYLILVGTLQGQVNFNIELLAEVAQPEFTNDIWGYIDSSGTEYAIVGTRADAGIYDLSNPSSPREVARIPGTRSIWRDFKTYGNFIFQTTDEGADGLRIIDMTSAPDSISTFIWTDTIQIGSVNERLRKCHNLWIDDEGIAYLAGCNNQQGGVWMVDIGTDPYNPSFIGAINERYAHDVFVRDTILYASEINVGALGIYNIADKQNPILLSRTTTSTNFTHNAWTSDDGNYVFTTDERLNSNVDAYDITNPSEPIRIDTYNPRPGESTIPHNVHYLDGFLIVSWYTEGILILDAHRPDNLVRVGQYDTHPEGNSGSGGCWGAYPFLPSGLLLGSDQGNGLFVLEPNYKRAAYLEGLVVDITNDNRINNASVTILSQDPISDLSNASGVFKTGTPDSGFIEVVVSQIDYITDTVLIHFQNGEVVDTTFFLVPKSLSQISGTVTDTLGKGIAGAVVQMVLPDATFEGISDENGNYNILSFDGNGSIRIGAWGYKGLEMKVDIEGTFSSNFELSEGYEDDFFANLGWEVGGDAVAGNWTLGTPNGTIFQGRISNPDTDLPDDIGNSCFVTGNKIGGVGFDDVDDGTTILSSPIIDISNMENPQLEVTPWYFNEGGESTRNDTLFFYIDQDNELTEVAAITGDDLINGWRAPLELKLEDFNISAPQVQLRIVASDLAPFGHLVEAGIDRFRVIDLGLTTSTSDPVAHESIHISPNPASSYISVDFSDNVSDIEQYRIVDLYGRIISQGSHWKERIEIQNFPDGLYLLDIWAGEVRYQGKFIKTQ